MACTGCICGNNLCPPPAAVFLNAGDTVVSDKTLHVGPNHTAGTNDLILKSPKIVIWGNATLTNVNLYCSSLHIHKSKVSFNNCIVEVNNEQKSKTKE